MDVQLQQEPADEKIGLNSEHLNFTNEYVSLFIIYIFYDLPVFLCDFIFGVKYLLKKTFEVNLNEFQFGFYSLNIVDSSFESKIFLLLCFVLFSTIVFNLIAWKLFSKVIVNFKLNKGKLLILICIRT
jgi:hypothetical protein